MNHIKFDPDESFYFHHGMSKRVAETGASWPHYHSLYEIYFLEEGNCTYIIDNKVFSVQPINPKRVVELDLCQLWAATEEAPAAPDSEVCPE